MVAHCTRPTCFGDRGSTSSCPSGSSLTESEVATIAGALAHPARLAIIGRFSDGAPKLTKELVAPSGLAPSTMSKHLRILRDAELLTTRRDGPGIWYCLCQDRLAEFAGSVQQLVDDGCLTA